MTYPPTGDTAPAASPEVLRKSCVGESARGGQEGCARGGVSERGAGGKGAGRRRHRREALRGTRFPL